jgi:hypothetical protein
MSCMPTWHAAVCLPHDGASNDYAIAGGAGTITGRLTPTFLGWTSDTETDMTFVNNTIDGWHCMSAFGTLRPSYDAAWHM